MRWSPAWRLPAVAALMGPGAAATQAQPPETQDDAWIAAARAPLTSRPYALATDGLFIQQVNVDAQGMNILGDAANEPSIAIDPTAPNRIVIGWRQFDTIASNFRQAGYAWSNDGGRSWHFEGSLTPGVFRSDPVLESDSDGSIYYYTLLSTFVCELFKSTDGGRTWSGPVPANGGDRAWMAIDKSGGIGDGNIYGIWSAAGASFGRDLSSGLLPWPPPFVMPSPTTQSGTIAVGPDGEVYVIGRNNTFKRSDNAQDPGQTPTFALSATILGFPFGWASFPGNPGGAPGQAWVEVNRTNGPNRGHVYALALNAGPGGPSDVFFARSASHGATWSTPVRVNDSPPGNNRCWFPSLSAAGDRIDITYNSTHETGTTSLSRTYYTFSTDNGQTWAPSVALTPVWNSTIGWPNQNKIGDYYDQESDDVGLFLAIATTVSGGQDVYFVRVGDWDCNRNGIPDAQDLKSGFAADCDGNAIPDSCEIAAGAKQDVNQNGIPDVCECYADCNADFALTIADFGCFQTRYVLVDPYADCNGDGSLTIADFGCFQTKFVGGCP